jgi:hypothetical protein
MLLSIFIGKTDNKSNFNLFYLFLNNIDTEASEISSERAAPLGSKLLGE